MKIGDQIQNGKKDVSVKEKCLAVLKRYGLARISGENTRFSSPAA